MTQTYFREVQKFPQVWLWVLVLPSSLASIGIFGYGMVSQLVFGRPWGDEPMSDFWLAVLGLLMIALGIGMLYAFLRMRLVTEVRDDGVYVGFEPFTRRTMMYVDILRCEARQYSPVLDYGGWGIRWSPWRGWAYNVSGNMGVQLEMRDGKRLLIGSQHAQDLASAIRGRMDAAAKH